jgi:Asp-tRNA(Asn)/Glu-tRNA(Gln) amidotransferase A subunit family amidase
MGITVQPVTFPDSAVYPFNMVSIILNAESAAAFDELTRTDRDSLIERQDKDFWPNSFRAARYIPAVEYINANRYRSRLCAQVQDFMKAYDVVIVPTFAGSQLSITNLTGNPALCMPMGSINVACRKVLRSSAICMTKLLYWKQRKLTRIKQNIIKNIPKNSAADYMT